MANEGRSDFGFAILDWGGGDRGFWELRFVELTLTSVRRNAIPVKLSIALNPRADAPLR
ncbi:MAG: hypothetical protein VKJ24_07095 [Synechococcales bacterium]|nr:hypothetical protein [Synechococcales bacterium]